MLPASARQGGRRSYHCRSALPRCHCYLQTPLLCFIILADGMGRTLNTL